MLSSLLALGNAASAQAPSITDVQPRFGSPGAPISISGANFDFSAGLNKSYFGATKSSAYGGSTGQINATLAVGSTYAPVQVYNVTTGLWAISPMPFMPTYSGPYQQNVFNFEPFYQLTGTTHPISPTIVDVDGDGMPDIVVPATADPATSLPTIAIYRNLMTNPGSFTNASFASPVHITNPGTSLGIETVFADIDGDGQRDLIVADNSAQTIGIFRNTSTPGSISFGARAGYPVTQVHDIVDARLNIFWSKGRLPCNPGTRHMCNRCKWRRQNRHCSQQHRHDEYHHTRKYSNERRY
jgi:hypothetical protein